MRLVSTLRNHFMTLSMSRSVARDVVVGDTDFTLFEELITSRSRILSCEGPNIEGRLFYLH